MFNFWRREESLPIFKRRLLSGLLDFAARELQVQVNVVMHIKFPKFVSNIMSGVVHFIKFCKSFVKLYLFYYTNYWTFLAKSCAVQIYHLNALNLFSFYWHWVSRNSVPINLRGTQAIRLYISIMNEGYYIVSHYSVPTPLLSFGHYF